MAVTGASVIVGQAFIRVDTLSKCLESPMHARGQAIFGWSFSRMGWTATL